VDAADLDKQVDALKEVSARPINPCITAQFIAIADARVRDLLLKKVGAGNVFRGVSCLDTISIPEIRHVYFDLDCRPDTFCFVKPAFVVVVNIIDGYVVTIVDPFIRSSQSSAGTMRLRVQKTLSEAEAVSRARDGTLPLRLGDGTLPLASDGTLPLGGGTLPLRVTGFILVPEWGVQGG
jgi:hypothetical protein